MLFKNLNDECENGQTVRFNEEQVKIIGRGLSKVQKLRLLEAVVCVSVCGVKLGNSLDVDFKCCFKYYWILKKA